MSNNKTFVAIFSIVTIFYLPCSGEFPITRVIDFSSIKEEIQKVHLDLKKIITKVKHEDKNQNKRNTNYFSVSLSFSLVGQNDLKNLTITEEYLNKTNRATPLVTKNSYISGCDYKGALNTNVVQTIQNMQSEFFEKVNDPQSLIVGDLFKTINNRFHQYFSSKTPSYILLNTDSESYMLTHLSNPSVQANIINEIIKLINDNKINEIIFNGCTTRTMCGLCCTNINILQYITNQDVTSKTFLLSIKNELKRKGLVENTCPITTYISCITHNNSPWFCKHKKAVPNQIEKQCVNIFLVP